MNILPLKVYWSPINVILDPTNKCNFKCSICYAQFSKEKQCNWSYLDYQVAMKELSPRSINFGVTGEPFLNKHFESMVKDAKERGIKIIVSTNGSLLEKCTWLDKIDVLKISLDACELETYEKIRKNKHLPEIVSSIKKLIKIGKPIIRFEFTPVSTNYEEMSKFMIFAKSLGVDIVFFRLFQNMGLPKDLADELSNVPYLETEVIITLYTAKKLKMHSNIGDWKDNIDFIKDVYSRKPINDERRKKVCLLPWTQFVVLSNGGVGPCCNLSLMSNVYVGNIKTGTDLWNSSEMQKMRKIFREKKNYDLYEPCSNCEYLDFKRLFKWTRLMPNWLF